MYKPVFVDMRTAVAACDNQWLDQVRIGTTGHDRAGMIVPHDLGAAQ